MADKDGRRLAPYGTVPPGFEAVYTGEDPSVVMEPSDSHYLNPQGNVVRKWSVWTWTDEPGQWDEEIRHLNRMQEQLGPLDDDTRQIRAHIGSLVTCDSGIPVTIDEILCAIGKGRLDEPTFHNGCWCGSMWWEARTTQPHQPAAMQVVEEVLRGYLDGQASKELIARHPHVEGFIRRTYEHLGPRDKLTELQRLMFERMMLPFEFFTGRNTDYQVVNAACFEKGGHGPALDARIAELGGLPVIYMRHLPEFRDNLEAITDPKKRDLYQICCHMAQGVHGLSDCHVSTFRYIENWTYWIGTGTFETPRPRVQAQKERLGSLLFGYVFGLDKWLLQVPMHFLLLDLGHTDLKLNPRDDILRVYAYLGEQRTSVKEWLAACLWRILMHNLGGLTWHKAVLELAERSGLTVGEWMRCSLQMKNNG